MAKPIEALIQKEMSRKEFIGTLGLGVATLMGASTIVHLLTGKSLSSQSSQANHSAYSGGAYGGPKRTH